MASGKYLFGIDGIAASDLTAKRGYAMTFGADGDHLDVISDAPQAYAGVLINNPDVGQVAQTILLGEAPCMADGTTDIAVGDSVGPNDSGVMVKKATGDYSVWGIARDALTDAGPTEIRVLLLGPHPFRTQLD